VDELLSKERNIDLLLMGKKSWVENGETSRKEDRVRAEDDFNSMEFQSSINLLSSLI
jgi:hypothetical protein